MYCRKCGVENEKGAKFCKSCGEPMEVENFEKKDSMTEFLSRLWEPGEIIIRHR